MDLRWVPADEIPARNALLATLLEVSFPDPKIAPRALCRVPLCHLPTPPAPQFFGFLPLVLKIFKNFFAQSPRHRPPCAESPRRTLAPSKNRGIPRQNRPSAHRRRPKITRKTPLQNPKIPTPHTPPHKKVELNTLKSIDSPSEKVHT